MSSSVNLLILLQLPGDGIRAPLLVLAVILAGLTALAAETPHDTPRERHARLTLFALPFHFCCSLLFSVQRNITTTPERTARATSTTGGACCLSRVNVTFDKYTLFRDTRRFTPFSTGILPTSSFLRSGRVCHSILIYHRPAYNQSFVLLSNSLFSTHYRLLVPTFSLLSFIFFLFLPLYSSSSSVSLFCPSRVYFISSFRTPTTRILIFD